jgi:MoaA/NifB/PqqE/SkfB family radical SAM enzyme
MSITERIDQITHIPKEYLTPTPPAPKSVKIELTSKCNYRCKFCPLVTREAKPQVMDFDLFKRITKEMLEVGVEEIGVFFFGESLTSPDYTVEAIKYLKSIGTPYVFLTTNGSLCTPDIAHKLFDAGLDSLKFSLNASDREQFKDVMDVKPKLYDNALNNVKLAYRVREEGHFKTKLYASSIRYDGEQQERMQAIVDSILPYVDEHYWLPLYSMGSEAAKREAELGYRPIAGNQGRADNPVNPLPCWSAFTEGHVFVDGTFSVCCFDADGVFSVGDLKTESFMEVWHSDKFQHIRNAHLKDDLTGTLCEQCLAYA